MEALRGRPAPHWGLYAQGLRALLDALLLYLPLALLGRQPSMPSYFTFLPDARYYAALAVLSPFVLLMQWLFLTALVHLILRLLGRAGGIDTIMNITGIAALVMGALLVAWDWVWIAMGWHNANLLGISHLLLDLWGVAIIVIGLWRLLHVPDPPGLALAFTWIRAGMPLAILMMRPPV